MSDQEIINDLIYEEEIRPLPKKRGRKCKGKVIENISDVVSVTDSVATDNTELDLKKISISGITKEDWYKALFNDENKKIEKEEQDYLDRLKSYNPNSIVKKEYVDTRVLDLLIEKQDFIEDKSLVAKLVTYRKKLIAGKSYTYVTYNYKKPNNVGRLYASEYGSMQQMQKDIRAVLLSGIYFDIDMSNAITPILIKLAKSRNKNHTFLDSYLNERDHWFSKISTDRDYAKQVVLIIINGGAYNCSGNYLLKGLLEEVNELKKLVWDLQLIDKSYADSKDKEDAKINSLFSLYIQTEENKILKNIIKTFEENGRDVDILTFDGCAVRRKEGEDIFPPQLMRLAESNVNRFLNYDIALVQKQFNTTKYDFIKDSISSNVKISQYYAAAKFFDFYSDRIIIIDDKMMLFNPNKGIYTSDRKEMHVILQHYKDKLTFKTKKDVKEFYYGADAENMLNSLEIFAIASFADSVNENDLIKRIDESFHIIAFTDGLYNWHTGEFIPRYDPYYVLYDRENVKLPVKEDGDEVIMDEIFNILFKDSFEENCEGSGKYMLDSLCLAMLGKYTHRNLVFGIGASSSAKSLLMDMCKQCFGKTSVICVPAYVFLKNNADDQSLQNKDLYKAMTRGYKIIFASEIDPDGRPFDINKLKNLSSGGKDEIYCRKLQQESIGKVCKALIVILCNGIPYLVGADDAFKSRLKIVKYYYSFVDDVTESHHKPINRKIDDLFKTKTYMRCFRLLIMKRCLEIVKNNYKIDLPYCVTSELANYVKTDAEKITEKLNEKYDITRDDEDFVLFSDLSNFIKTEYNFDDNKIIKLLTDLKLTKTKCVKCSDGLKKMARVGIKLREPEIIMNIEDEVMEIFNKKYEFCDKKEYVRFKEISDYILYENGLEMTITSLGKWLSHYGCEIKNVNNEKVRMGIREKKIT